MPSISPDAIEHLVEVALGSLAALGEDPRALERFADAWDHGDLTPGDLMPRVDGVAAAIVGERSGLPDHATSFVAGAALRPPLETYFMAVPPALHHGVWDLGRCPLCGGPPAFGDITAEGGRRLACHLCGATWVHARTRCPLCGTDAPSDLIRLDLGPDEEGYHVAACKRCHGYVKEVDRRTRWNAGSALIEDWGSPHFDLAARRAGYRRPLPSLIDLAGGR